MSKELRVLERAIKQMSNPTRAKLTARYFKTGKGEYGEGDQFLGLTVPQLRELAKQYQDLALGEVKQLLKSKFHEFRLVGLLILVSKFVGTQKTQDYKIQDKIYKFYLANITAVNNWDLVDLSAPTIVGGYLFSRSKNKLYNLARSENLWSRRIAIVATLHFIRYQKFFDTLKLAKIFLTDKADLIHKATGWALREVGKQDEKVLKQFLQKNCHKMPRTMLRYAIEKFPKILRQKYLAGEI